MIHVVANSTNDRKILLSHLPKNLDPEVLFIAYLYRYTTRLSDFVAQFTKREKLDPSPKLFAKYVQEPLTEEIPKGEPLKQSWVNQKNNYADSFERNYGNEMIYKL